MEDPRIEELMDYIDSVDDSGQPTAVALIAKRVASYLEVVDDLRDQLSEAHGAVEDLEDRASNISIRLKERDGLRVDITDQAQTAAMKVAYTTTTGRGAQLRQDAAEKHRALQQFEAEYAEDQKRYKEVMRARTSREERLLDLRDQIARRLNIIDALLQRAEIEWPSYFFDENERIKARKKSATSSSTRRRSGRGGRRRVIRRRRAS